MRMIPGVAQLATFSALLDPAFDFFKLAEFHDGDRYTVHGLWPTRASGSWPEFCAGPPFNATALDGLQPRLEQDWPNYFGSSLALHRHEYQRHGTCSGLTELQYFSAALAAYERYSLNSLLQPSAVPPPVSTLRALFLARYGVPLGHSRSRHGRAFEAAFCLDKRLQLMPCPA